MYINWSNLNLGKFALTKINIKAIKIVFNENIKTQTKLFNNILVGKIQIYLMIKKLPPDKKKITNKLDISKILAYSPKKKAANRIAEYSTL
jgi:hypothetical protein